MNKFSVFFLLICINLSLEFCFYEETPRIQQRISVQKCEEWKGEVADKQLVGKTLWCPGVWKIVDYKCNNFVGLIVGGEKTKPKEFPHMAAIGWKTPGGSLKFNCGGSLISERFVLTVAHCVLTSMGEPQVVRLGEQNLLKPDSEDGARAVEYNIARTIVHEGYHATSKKNDIALLKLEKDVKFNEHVRPACLQQDDNFNKTVVATGWGQTSTYSETTDELFKVHLKTWDNRKCEDKIGDEIPDGGISSSQICAGGERNKDTCQGDSGGPIQVSHPEAKCVYNIVGLTSYGLYTCGTRNPSIYTKVSSYIDWIEKHVWQ